MMSIPQRGQLPDEVGFILRALDAAAHILHTVGRSTSTARKEDRTPVTTVDLAVQAAVAGLLVRVFPDDILVGEENADVLRNPRAARLRAATLAATRLVHPGVAEDQLLAWLDRGRGEPVRRFWTLDPVDGTKGLLRGGQFAAALALIEGGAVVLGGMACPRYPVNVKGGSVAVAVRGDGAWFAPSTGGPWARLTVSDEARPQRCRLVRSVVSGRETSRRLAAIRSALGTNAPETRMDSQVKYLAVAAGDGETVVRLPRKRGVLLENIWDHACGVLLVEEAGGTCTDTEGRPLDFASARQMVRNRGVVASNGRLHAAILDALRTTAADRSGGAL